MDLAAQERAYREDDRTSSELETHRSDDAGHAAVLDPEVGDLGLEQRQVRLVLDDRTDRLAVETLLALSVRNWMPARSIARAMAPPSASISRTRCPLPMAPIAGLQLICPRASMLCVTSSVRAPRRAEASAASVPAWPPPTTITSKFSATRVMGTL